MAGGLVAFDKRVLGGSVGLVGIDEAGRGCLAGPVVAAAVSFRREFYFAPGCGSWCRGVDDSKRLSPQERAGIVRRFRMEGHRKWMRIGIGVSDVGEIERYNIFHATVLAMRRACESIGLGTGAAIFREGGEPDSVSFPLLIDGRPLRTFPLPHQGVIGGDRRSFAIALAGIHAKEARDEMMRELDRSHPGYHFGSHKGYSTAAHLAALRVHGPTKHHRQLFLRNFRKASELSAEALQDSLFEATSPH